MPKYACRCGYVMNLSRGWAEYELMLVPETIVEELGEKMQSQAVSADEFYECMDKSSLTVYRCPQCKRLHVEEERNRFTIYSVERLEER